MFEIVFNNSLFLRNEKKPNDVETFLYCLIFFLPFLYFVRTVQYIVCCQETKGITLSCCILDVLYSIIFQFNDLFVIISISFMKKIQKKNMFFFMATLLKEGKFSRHTRMKSFYIKQIYQPRKYEINQ